MTTAANEIDFLAALFGNQTEAERAAGLAAMVAAETKRLNTLRADEAVRLAAAAAHKAANACPKCAGRGYLPQFQHRKGGECFACGATGVFTRYAA